MIYLIAFIVFFVFVLFNKDSVLKNDSNQGKEGLKPLEADSYKPNIFMTENEIEFFHRLITAFPEHYVFPQVAMAALISPKSTDFKKINSIKNTYNRVHVDFILYKDNKIIAVIELDDKTHKGKEDKDAKRDGMLSQAGYTTYRFESTNKPSIEKLKQIINI